MFSGVMNVLMLETVKHINVTYNLGNLADWLSAIGTIAAVAVSLYLANRKPKPFLIIRAFYFPEEKAERTPEGILVKGLEENITIQIENENSYPVVMVPQNHRNILDPVLGVHENELYIAGRGAKANTRAMRITNFNHLIFKKFVIRDIYSNKSYKFRFIKENNQWIILYPLRLKSYIKIINCIAKQLYHKIIN